MNRTFLNTTSLFFAQAFGMLNTVVFVFIGGLVFANLHHNAVEATLPFTLVVFGTAAAAYPAKALMARFGRKKCFLSVAVFSSIAIGIATISIAQGWFWIFCLASLVIGIARYFMMQYRFAITDGVSEKKSSQLVSVILLGSILSAVMGTRLVDLTKDLSHTLYVGSFFTLFILSLVVIIALIFYKDVASEKKTDTDISEKASFTVTPKNFIPTVALSTLSYFVMSFVMVAAPLQINELSHFSIDITGSVMQWHFIAMYLPSLFFHPIAKKMGIYTTISFGVTLFLISALSALFLPLTYAYYLVTMICLGAGWNFCFIGSTVILKETYNQGQHLKAQATNDFSVFAFNIIACLFAGKLLFSISWLGMNLIALGLSILMALCLMIILYNKKRMAKTSI